MRAGGDSRDVRVDTEVHAKVTPPRGARQTREVKTLAIGEARLSGSDFPEEAWLLPRFGPGFAR